MLSSKEVERMRDELGRDLRVDEAAARRSRSNKTSEVLSEAASKSEPPQHRLPLSELGILRFLDMSTRTRKLLPGPREA